MKNDFGWLFKSYRYIERLKGALLDNLKRGTKGANILKTLKNCRYWLRNQKPQALII